MGEGRRKWQREAGGEEGGGCRGGFPLVVKGGRRQYIGTLVPTGSEGWEEAINLPALHMSQRRI